MILPFTILATVPFIMVLGNSMLIPVFPQLKRELNLTQFQVGLLVTAFSIPAGIVIPFAGALSDHIGRKTIMFPALLLYGAGGLIAGFASLWLDDPFGWILGGRIVQGIGAGGTYQIALALPATFFKERSAPKPSESSKPQTVWEKWSVPSLAPHWGWWSGLLPFSLTAS